MRRKREAQAARVVQEDFFRTAQAAGSGEGIQIAPERTPTPPAMLCCAWREKPPPFLPFFPFLLLFTLLSSSRLAPQAGRAPLPAQQHQQRPADKGAEAPAAHLSRQAPCRRAARRGRSLAVRGMTRGEGCARGRRAEPGEGGQSPPAPRLAPRRGPGSGCASWRARGAPELSWHRLWLRPRAPGSSLQGTPSLTAGATRWVLFLFCTGTGKQGEQQEGRDGARGLAPRTGPRRAGSSAGSSPLSLPRLLGKAPGWPPAPPACPNCPQRPGSSSTRPPRSAECPHAHRSAAQARLSD